VQLALAARGANGACTDYVLNVQRHLLKLGISDPFVEEFATELRRGGIRSPA
jgi:cation transport regulator ChaC